MRSRNIYTKLAADRTTKVVRALFGQGPRSALEDVSTNPRLASMLGELRAGVQAGKIDPSVFRREVAPLGRGYDGMTRIVASPSGGLEVAKAPYPFRTSAGNMLTPRVPTLPGGQLQQVATEVGGHLPVQQAWQASPAAQAMVQVPLVGRQELATVNRAGKPLLPFYTMQGFDVKGGLPMTDQGARSAAKAVAGIQAIEREGGGPQLYDAHQGNVGYLTSGGAYRQRPVLFDFGRTGVGRVRATPFTGDVSGEIRMLVAPPGKGANPLQEQITSAPFSSRRDFTNKVDQIYQNATRDFYAQVGRNTNAPGSPGYGVPSTPAVSGQELLNRKAGLADKRNQFYDRLLSAWKKNDAKQGPGFAAQQAAYPDAVKEYGKIPNILARVGRRILGLPVEPAPTPPVRHTPLPYPDMPPYWPNTASVQTGAPELGYTLGANWQGLAQKLNVPGLPAAPARTVTSPGPRPVPAAAPGRVTR